MQVFGRINTVLLLLVLLALLGVLAMLAAGTEGGPLDPPAAPASSRPQVEPRSPIPPDGWNGQFPITISQPGSYYLTRNLTGVSGQHGILIAASNVTLDLNGFTLLGAGGSLDAIHSDGSYLAIVIRNGIFQGWQDAIEMRFAGGIHISDVMGFGIEESAVVAGPATTVRDCNFYAPGTGIAGYGAIDVGEQSLIADCRIQGTGALTGIKLRGEVASRVRDCIVVDYSYDLLIQGSQLVTGCVLAP